MLKERFFNYLRFEKRFSPLTIKSYQNDLSQFERYIFLQYQLDDLKAVDHLMIRSWLVQLLESKITPRSVNRKLSTLKSFYHFCLKDGSISSNPTLKVIAPKIGKHLPGFLEKDRIEQLFNDIDFGKDFEGLRNRLIVMMFYATGIRRAELIEAKVSNIDFGSMTIKVLGKRSKERIIPIGSYLFSILSIYINERDSVLKRSTISSIEPVKIQEGPNKEFVHEELRGEQNNNDLLFVTSEGKKMGPRQVYGIVHKYLAMISSKSKVSPHILRHTFATHLLNEGADLNAIKELLGHTSLAATQVYTHNSIEKLKQIYQQAHPRA